MATPNYPNQMQMQQMQQMQQMPMGPPQGAMPPPSRAVRRGTSKAVPVVMSAGLAVGVFCGLLFGLGTGADDAVAAPSAQAKRGSDDVPDVLRTPTVADGTAKKVVPLPPPTTVPAVAATGSGSAAAGSAAGSAAAVAANAPKLKIDLPPDVKPEAAKITVDGKDYAPDATYALDATGKKTVDVVVVVDGYKDVESKVDLAAGLTEWKVDGLQKKPVAPPPPPPVAQHHNTGGNAPARPVWTGTQTVQPQAKQPPKPPVKKPPAKPGLIDI